MHTKVMLNMDDQNALVTVAMLSTMLKERNSDYLDIISPFILTLLPHKIGSCIDDDKIICSLKDQYGFEEFPHHVLTKLLKRFCKQKYGYLEQRSGNFYVRRSYEYNERFYNDQTKIREAHSDVMNQLQEYLKFNTRYKNITVDGSRKMFISFLEKKGISFIDGMDTLKTFTSDDYDFYHIARFIVSEYEKRSIIYSKIEEVVRGFFVYKSIYFFSNNENASLTTHLKNTVIYFDTRLLIEALGFNTEKGKAATRELISLIINCGGKVKTFSHLVDEVKGILYAYMKDTLNRASFSLQHFLDNDFDEYIITIYRDSLESQLNKLGIEVEDSLNFSFLNNDEFAPLQLGALTCAVQNAYREISPTQRSLNDVLSVATIYKMRGFTKCTSIERCPAIMATSNQGLVWTIRSFYQDLYSDNTDLVMSDIELTSLLWLKSWNKKSDIPSLVLLENAYAACRLSSDVFTVFCDTVEKLRTSGEITTEQAILLRTQRVPRDHLLEKTQNNVEAVNERMVLDIEQRYEKSLTEDQHRQIDELKSKEKKRRHNAIGLAEKMAKDKADKLEKRLVMSIRVVCMLLIIWGSAALCIGQFISGLPLVTNILLAIFGVFGFVDSVNYRFGVIRRLIVRTKNQYFAKIHDREIVRINQIFGESEE